MIGFVTGFGPEIPNEAYRVVEELEGEIRTFDQGLGKTKGRFSTIVINFVAINPSRGVIPDGVSLKRMSGELWSTSNLDFNTFLHADAQGRKQALKEAVCRSIKALEGKYIQPEDISKIVERISQI